MNLHVHEGLVSFRKTVNVLWNWVDLETEDGDSQQFASADMEYLGMQTFAIDS